MLKKLWNKIFQPSNLSTIEICGQSFDKTLSHFSFNTSFFKIEKMSELEKLKALPNLKSASFVYTNLDDIGLEYVCANENIDNLDLQSTQISNKGLQYLGQLKHLKHLRLKENDQLTNACIPYLNQLGNLVDLQIHETSINQEGLKLLAIKKLENLLIYIEEDNFNYEAILAYSRRNPTCEILAKGKEMFYNGKVVTGEEDYEEVSSIDVNSPPIIQVAPEKTKSTNKQVTKKNLLAIQGISSLIKLPIQPEELFGGSEQFFFSNQVELSIENQENIKLKVAIFENNSLTKLAQILNNQLFNKIITAGNFQKKFLTYKSKYDLEVYYAYYTTSNNQYLVLASLGEKQPHLYLFCLEAVWKIVD